MYLVSLLWQISILISSEAHEQIIQPKKEKHLKEKLVILRKFIAEDSVQKLLENVSRPNFH